jgi:hypothetical protein
MPLTGGITLHGANGGIEIKVDRPGGGTEDTVTITFTPKDSVKCKDIRLAQTVRATAYDRRGRVVTNDRAQMYVPPGDHFPWRTPNQTFDADGNPVVIDTLACEGDPWYNGDDEGKDTKSQGSSPPPVGTTMTDSPGEPFTNIAPAITEIVKDFETCAICVETGECLGCIQWASTSRRGSPGQTSVTMPDKVKPCSSVFQTALKGFIERHTKVDPADKKLKWYCPETDDTIKGPTGETNKPYGGEVPEGLRKRFLEDRHAFAPRIAIDETLVGTGRFAAAPAVHAACLANPSFAGVQFMWTGPHDKSVPSVLLTPVERLYPDEVSPFVRKDPQFVLNLQPINLAVVSQGFMTQLLTALAPQVTSGAVPTGPTLVTLIAELRSEAAQAAVISLPVETVHSLMQQVARHPDVNEELLGTLHYLAINMGRKPA